MLTATRTGEVRDWVREGLALRVNGRMLLAYADESYEEWGYIGSLIYEPGAAGRGLRMRLGFGLGGALLWYPYLAAARSVSASGSTPVGRSMSAWKSVE